MTHARVRCPVSLANPRGRELCGRPAVGYLDPLPDGTDEGRIAYPVCAFHLHLWDYRAVPLDRIPHSPPWKATKP